MLRAAVLGAVLLPPLGDGSRVRHIEPIGAGACLVFEKPVLVDRGPSSGRLSAPAPIGSPDNETFFMPAITYVSLGQHQHFHANFDQRLYLSTSGGDTWSREGEARPCSHPCTRRTRKAAPSCGFSTARYTSTRLRP